MFRLLQFEEGEDHLAAGLQRAKGIDGVEIEFTGIEMGEDRPVKYHVQRCVGRDDPRLDVENDIIARTLPGQLVDQFLNDVRANISALPSGAFQRR